MSVVARYPVLEYEALFLDRYLRVAKGMLQLLKYFVRRPECVAAAVYIAVTGNLFSIDTGCCLSQGTYRRKSGTEHRHPVSLGYPSATLPLAQGTTSLSCFPMTTRGAPGRHRLSLLVVVSSPF